jgi:hypothetical protein
MSLSHLGPSLMVRRLFIVGRSLVLGTLSGHASGHTRRAFRSIGSEDGKENATSPQVLGIDEVPSTSCCPRSWILRICDEERIAGSRSRRRFREAPVF